MSRSAHRGSVIGTAGVLALAAVLYCGCQAPRDPAVLRHYNWWNYYERGLYFLNEGELERARNDFECALGLRPSERFGFDTDMWRARTYGMHYVKNYFPNRELGVCLYHLGDTEKAVEFLEKSRRQEPSGRAKHFLNLARKRLLAGKSLEPPTIDLAPSSRKVWTSQRRRLVEGTARGPGRVQGLIVADCPEFIELAEEEYPIRRPVDLVPGTNTVIVEAVDLLGQRTTRKIVWVADWTPPRLVFHRVERKADHVLVQASCRDNAALASVTAGGEQHLKGLAEGETRSEIPLELKVPLQGGLDFLAEDKAGNQLKTVLRESDLGGLAGLWGCPPALAGHVLVHSALVMGPAVLAAASTDRMKPSLKLSFPGTRAEVFKEQFFLDGDASDPGGLVSITVNGEENLVAGDRGAVRATFARRVDLDPGTNRFEIIAQDRAGNRRTRELVVVRQAPDYLHEEYRLSIGLPPIAGDSWEQRPVVEGEMQKELTRQPVRFRLLERREGWDFVLREQRLSRSDLADRKAALRIGKMLPAQMLLMGSLHVNTGGVTIRARVVETTDAGIVMSDDVYFDPRTHDLEKQVAGLVMKVEQRFPLVQSHVLDVKGESVTIGLGHRQQEQEIPRAARFIVIAKPGDGGGIAEGAVRCVGERPVELSMKSMQSNTSTAVVHPPAGAGVIKQGDYIYTR